MAGAPGYRPGVRRLVVLIALTALAAVTMARALHRPAPARRVVLPRPAPACAPAAAAAAPAIARPVVPGDTAPSNVDDADYVGPARCAACHPVQAAGWRAGHHRTMTQAATRAAVTGAFDGQTVAYAGGRARFTWDRDAPAMTLTGADGTVRRYRVTRTIGTRALQEYVGVRDGDAAAVEERLPFAWWVARAGWYPQPYYDSWFDAEWHGDRPAVDVYAAAEPWADRCAWCHNTYPFVLRAARPDRGVGPEVDLAPIPPLIADNHLPIERLVTVGISCESCHLGGRAHAAAPDDQPPVFAPRGPAVVARAGAALPPDDRDDPRTLGAICAQCHSTPSPRFADGSAARNSSEALAMASGACASELRCVDCHEPHTPGARSGGPDQPAHVAACTRCHAYLATAAVARDHAHHDPARVTCLDCHLPRLVQGVGVYLRSHRISSPTDRRMLATGAPNACNLCHLDRSIAWTARALTTWGHRVTPAPAWEAAYGGDLDLPVGPAWLGHREAYVRLAAAWAYARAGDRGALPRLVEALDDPVANTRMWMLMAIEALAGRRLRADEYDPLAPPAARAAQLPALRRWDAAVATASARSAR